MSGKEMAITILGLAGTFCLPWPGAPEAMPAPEAAGLHAAACPARPLESGRAGAERARVGAGPARVAQGAAAAGSMRAVGLPGVR